MSHKRFSVLALLIAALSGLLIAAVALAQETTSAGADDVTMDDINLVARELWCPLCNGVRLDACELQACDQMKDMIAIKLDEGDDLESIKGYFVEQYGPQVLGEPPREGFNWLAWILPVVAVVVGGIFVWRQTQRMMKPTAHSALASEAQQASAPPVTGSAGPDDEYVNKLEEELSKYG